LIAIHRRPNNPAGVTTAITVFKIDRVVIITEGARIMKSNLEARNIVPCDLRLDEPLCRLRLDAVTGKYQVSYAECDALALRADTI
jgi:hypothetical protein